MSAAAAAAASLPPSCTGWCEENVVVLEVSIVDDDDEDEDEDDEVVAGGGRAMSGIVTPVGARNGTADAFDDHCCVSVMVSPDGFEADKAPAEAVSDCVCR